MNRDHATFEVLLLEIEAAGLDKTEAMAFLSNHGAPLEIVMRMDTFWDQAAMVGNQILHTGRIVTMKLIQFISENPNMAAGLALGLSLGMLSASIPFIGHLIAPMATIAFSTIGALKGCRLDRIMRGEYAGDNLIEEAIIATRQFWALFCEIFGIAIIKPIERQVR